MGIESKTEVLLIMEILRLKNEIYNTEYHLKLLKSRLHRLESQSQPESNYAQGFDAFIKENIGVIEDE